MEAITLEEAIRIDDAPGAAELIRRGADIDGRTAEGLTLLMVAAARGSARTVELLLEAGADVLTLEPVAGATALHKAALSGDPRTSALLLDHGAFVDQQSPILGHTPLMDAVVYKHLEVATLLLDRGARTSLRNHWGETALALAERDGLTSIAARIRARDEINEETIKRQTLAHAVSRNNIQEVKRLIKDGADLDARRPMTGTPDDDYTALAIAARDARVELVRLLLDAGAVARGTIGLFGGTALHEASYFGHAEVVRVMTDARGRSDQAVPDLNVRGTYNGMTPLHDAVWHGHLEAAKALVEAGHQLHVETHAGLTPRQLAHAYGYTELADFLARAEAGRRHG